MSIIWVGLMAAPHFPGEHESEEAVQNKNGFDLLPTTGLLSRMTILGKFFSLQNGLTNWSTSLDRQAISTTK